MSGAMSGLFAGFTFVVGALCALGGLILGVLFLLSLQRALERCSPENRTLAPGKVWLCFIPVFSAVWIFVVVSRVAGSLRREFESRGAPAGD